MSTWTFQPFPLGGTLLSAPLLTNTATFYSASLSFTGDQFPRIKATTTGSSSVNVTNHTVTLPAFVAGDLIIVIDAHDGGGVSSNVSTAGWTELHTGNRIGAAWRVMDGTEGSTVTLNCSASSQAAWTVYVIAAGSFDPAQAPEDQVFGSGTTLTPDPPSKTVTWGADNNLWFAAFGAPELCTVSAWPYENGRLTTTTTGGDDATIASCYGTTTADTENPGTFTRSSNSNSAETMTIGVRGFTASAGATVEPPLLTNANTLRAHSIRTILKPTNYTNSSTLRAHSIRTILKPAILTNSNTLRAHSIRRRLTAPLLANTNTLRAHSVRTTLKPVLFTNVNTFFAHRVVFPKIAPLLSNASTLRAHSVRTTLKPAILTNTNTLRAHSIRTILKPAALSNTSTLRAHSIRTRITAPLLTNANTLRAHSVRATIKLVNLVNSSTLRAHSIRTIIKPGVFTNTNTFYAHAVSVAGADLQVPLLTNTSILQAHSIRLRVTATNLVNGSVLYSHSIRRRLTVPRLTNSNTLFSHSIRRRVTASLLTNANTFYSHRLRTLVTASLLTNTNVFFGHTVLAGNNVSVPLLVNTNSFGAHTVIVAATDFVPSGNFGGWISHSERKRLDRESQRRAALARVKKLYARDVAVPHLVNQNRLYGHGVIILPPRDVDDLGLSPIEIDEITDILDALEAIEAMDTINDLTGRAS